MAPIEFANVFSDLFIRTPHEHKTRSPLIVGIAIGLCMLAFAICAVRLSIRIKRRTWGWEDGLIAFAMLFSILESVAACLAAKNGYGAPKATLSDVQLSSSLMWFWWAQILYKLTIWPTKLSILFLYRTVFGDTPSITSLGINFRKAVYGLMVFSAVFCVITLIVNIFTCIPVKSFWDTTVSGRCGVDGFSWWLSQSLLNTISDLFILVLPMPLVKNMKIHVRQKIGLCMVFGLGIFVVAVTVVRITTFQSGGLGADTTYDGAVTLCWTLVETNVAIICACLPLLRPFIARLIPGFCGRSSLRSNSYPMAQHPIDETPGNMPRTSHLPGNKRPRSWVGVETVISQGDHQTRSAGIHMQLDVDMITEDAGSICGTDSLRRLTQSRASNEAASSDSSR